MRRCTQGRSPFLARLACLKHAASVRSEPGSNSRLKPVAWACLPLNRHKKAPDFSGASRPKQIIVARINSIHPRSKTSDGFEQILAHRIGCQRAISLPVQQSGMLPAQLVWQVPPQMSTRIWRFPQPSSRLIAALLSTPAKCFGSSTIDSPSVPSRARTPYTIGNSLRFSLLAAPNRGNTKDSAWGLCSPIALATEDL